VWVVVVGEGRGGARRQEGAREVVAGAGAREVSRPGAPWRVWKPPTVAVEQQATPPAPPS
jgi:hypothetical protein